jgi:amidase
MPAPPDDVAGAFCRHDRVALEGATDGPLAGLTFAAKDVFAVAGVAACFGNPTWRETHARATATAPAVQACLRAGAALVGVTVTDELALSLTGENHHYGTPVNTRCPERVPGGSSSGSAAAVAAGMVDFALGTDTGGSVRVPASHCGIFGFRPTHGAVSTEGVLPLAPRFDTVGWFAREASVLERVGEALLPPGGAVPRAPSRLLFPVDVSAWVDPESFAVFEQQAVALAARLRRPVAAAGLDSTVAPMDAWLDTYLTLQNAEAAALHRDWIAATRPAFGSLIGGRIANALAGRATADQARAEAACGALRARLGGLITDGAWLLWPSAASIAPLRGSPDPFSNALTGRALTLNALASLAGLPQVSLPLGEVEGCPIGVSIVAPAGCDRALLAVAARGARRELAWPAQTIRNSAITEGRRS